MITHLFTYSDQGIARLHESISTSLTGIDGNRDCHIWRQVLVLPETSLQLFGLKETNLKENIIIQSGSNIHDLPSGTVIRLGEMELRLTFHCEPCKKIKHMVSPRKILHQRGYLGQIVKGGEVHLGDPVVILNKQYDSIPYEIADRIKWYLERQDSAVMVSKLVEDIGLSNSYCRAIPNIIKKRDDIDKAKIQYATKDRSSIAKEVKHGNNNQLPLKFQ